MLANKTLLQMKYARVISLFAERAGISQTEALGFFYHSTEYHLMREGIGDLHCMTDDYNVDDLMLEWKGHGRYDPPAAKLAEPAVQWPAPSCCIEDTSASQRSSASVRKRQGGRTEEE